MKLGLNGGILICPDQISTGYDGNDSSHQAAPEEHILAAHLSPQPPTAIMDMHCPRRGAETCHYPSTMAVIQD